MNRVLKMIVIAPAMMDSIVVKLVTHVKVSNDLMILCAISLSCYNC